MELVLPVLLTVSLVILLVLDTVMLLAARLDILDFDLMYVDSAFWDALHVFQVISAFAWPVLPEPMQLVPVFALSAPLDVQLAAMVQFARVVFLAMSYLEATALKVVPSLVPPVMPI